MGLASSQARLLSLTNRQHTIEHRAQSIQANKLRLANDTDKAYQKYLNALDETHLKTKQYDEKGKPTWIDASINNLLRYDTNENTTGTVFYVQDLETGKLYIPQAVGDKFEGCANAREFAEKFGVNYVPYDVNEEIKNNYDSMVSRGYQNALAGVPGKTQEEVYNAWYSAYYSDLEVKNYADYASSAIFLDDRVFVTNQAGSACTASNFVNVIEELKRASYYTANNDIYSAKEKELIQASINLMNSLNTMLPSDYTESGEVSDPYQLKEHVYDLHVTAKLPSTVGTDKYIDWKYYTDISENDYYSMMLNGGTLNYKGTESIKTTPKAFPYFASTTTSNKNVTNDIYNSSITTLLSQYGSERGSVFNNLGQALSSMFSRVKNLTHYESDYLATVGKTKTDIEHYQAFKEVAAIYNEHCENGVYVPKYEYIADNITLEKWCEQVFNSIKSAGGWIGVNDTRAKNTEWVGSMIKSTQVMLSVWDTQNEMLSKTATELHVNIREVTNENAVERASQEYDAEMEFINNKDAKYDTALKQMETERSAIQTEVDALKNVMKNNIDNTFKVFG